MKFKEIFTQAINTKSKIQVTFFSKEDNTSLTRLGFVAQRFEMQSAPN
ncbi:hypothetical protein [Acinetobacter baumannii]|nr:hypothetical protein [Acinetobacter baumannii]